MGGGIFALFQYRIANTEKNLYNILSKEYARRRAYSLLALYSAVK